MLFNDFFIACSVSVLVIPRGGGGEGVLPYIHTLYFHSNYQSSSIELISSRKKNT